MKWVSRSDWRAAYGRGPTNITPERGGVAIHWEGPRMGAFPHSSCDDKVRGIERYHVESNGWDGIAYTLLVCPHGYVFEGRGVGHRTAANGSNDGNQRYYAVCALLGKGDVHPPALFDGLADAVAYLRGKDAGDDLKPHSHFFNTECPGDRLRAWIKDPQEEDDMPLTDEDAHKVARAVHYYTMRSLLDGEEGRERPAHQILRHSMAGAVEARRAAIDVREAVAKVAATQAAHGQVLSALASGVQLDMAAVEAAAEEGARRALAESTIDVDVTVRDDTQE